MQTILPNAARLMRTVHHLQPGQVANRIVRRLRPAPRLDGATPVPRANAARWKPCAGRPRSLLSAERFRFLAAEADLGGPQGWNDAALPKLWLYNLHYFDD